MYFNIINTFLIKQTNKRTVSNLSETILNNSNQKPSIYRRIFDRWVYKNFASSSSSEEPSTT